MSDIQKVTITAVQLVTEWQLQRPSYKKYQYTSLSSDERKTKDWQPYY